ncbi:MAG: hypothetical protein OEZ06_24790 [Myxococcales bacterium]|nr:hypothetical protein [Myxococcales bacterium]
MTGQSELESAIAAVNHGAIFRFPSKPCGPDELLGAVAAGARLNEFIVGERKLLRQTLNGAATALTDGMSMAAPTAFSRVPTLKGYVRRLCSRLGITGTWPYELAAARARFGCITLPPDTLDRLYARHSFAPRKARW